MYSGKYKEHSTTKEGNIYLNTNNAETGHVGDHILLPHLVPVRLPGIGVILHLIVG